MQTPGSATNHSPAAHPACKDHPPALPQRHPLAASIIALALAALTGCGGSTASTKPSASASTPASSTHSPAASATKAPAKSHVPTVEKVEISSPVIPGAGEVPSRYTCDGANISPPLRWKGIPPGTAELQLDLIKVAPVGKTLLYSWAVTGLSPTLHGIPAGKLPAGAVVGLNGNGQARYDLCPPKGTNEEYVYVLFALPHALHTQAAFNAVTQRTQAVHNANYEGFLVFTYPRH